MALGTCKWCKSFASGIPSSIPRPKRWWYLATILLIALLGVLSIGVAVWSTDEPPAWIIGFTAIGTFFAVVGMIIVWIKRNVVGKRYFIFIDANGEQHIHECLFTGGFAGVGARAKHPNFIKRYVLAVRSGGWFRKNEVFRCERNFLHPFNPEAKPQPGEYKRSDAWKICRVQFNQDTEPIIWFTDDLQSNEPYVRYCFRAGVALAHMNHIGGYATLKDRVKQSETVRDELGILVIGVLEQIASLRSTLGRSQHAKAIRETMEKGLSAALTGSSEWESLPSQWREEYRVRKESAAQEREALAEQTSASSATQS